MGRWKLPWKGGCRCGKVRLRITKPPLITGACHCTGCRRMSGSAYSLTVTVPGDGLVVTKGEPVPGGLRGPVSHHFHCGDCKSWLFTRAEGMDWFVNVRAGALDDDRRFVPFIELWTREKLPWATMPARHSFETVPEFAEFGPLMQAFAEQATMEARGG